MEIYVIFVLPAWCKVQVIDSIRYMQIENSLIEAAYIRLTWMPQLFEES